MVGAGGDQVHAIDLDTKPVVSQAMDDGKTRCATRAVQADAGHIPEQAGRVAGRCLLGAQRVGSDGYRIGGFITLGGDNDVRRVALYGQSEHRRRDDAAENSNTFHC